MLNRLNTEFFIAKRLYLGKDKEKNVSSPAVLVAIISIALGLSAMILSVAIVIGFKKEVRNKVIGFGSHIQVSNFDSNSSYETQAISFSDSLINDINQLSGVKYVEKFATKPGIIKTKTNYQGIILKGVDEYYDWNFFQQNLLEGSTLVIHPDESSTDIMISRDITNKLNLHVDDSFITYFFTEEGARPRKFQIKGIYQTNFGEFDQLFMIGDIKQIRKMNRWDDDMATGLEIMVHDYNLLDDIAESLYFKLSVQQDKNGNFYYTRSIKQLNPQIFSWLDILDINVVVILLLIIIVAGFTMISGLIILILEQTQTIGILKALGYNNVSIRKIFLYIALFLIGKGLFWGNIVGISICFLQKQFGWLKLDPVSYYLTQVPIDINIWHITLLNIGIVFSTLLMLIGTSYIIARISPAKTIRFE